MHAHTPRSTLCARLHTHVCENLRTCVSGLFIYQHLIVMLCIVVCSSRRHRRLRGQPTGVSSSFMSFRSSRPKTETCAWYLCAYPTARVERGCVDHTLRVTIAMLLTPISFMTVTLLMATAVVILAFTWPCTRMGLCRYSVKWEIRRQAQNQRLLEVDFGISLVHAPGRKDEMGDDDDHSRMLHFQVN